METRANFVAVGFFTMAVILASFGFIYWVAQLDEGVAQRPITISIRGVVTGLAPGSDVHFNGIKVGKVTRVVFNPDDPREVLALAQINEDTPVRADTSATIAAQGLTGVSIVSLKGGTPGAKSLFDIAEPGEIPRIRARPSAVADILETVRDVSSKANDALGTLKLFIEENRTPVSNAVKNIETFSEAHAGWRPDRLRSLEHLARDLDPVRVAVVFPTDAASLEGAVESQTRGLIDAVLIGPEIRIRAVAEETGIDIGETAIVPADTPEAAAQRAAAMAAAGEVSLSTSR